MPDTSKTKETALAQQLLAGLQKHLANVTSLTVASADYTPAQIVTALQTLMTLRAAVQAAQAAAKAKVTAENAQAPALRAIMMALVAYVKLTFSESPDVLADFGLKPKKAPTPLTAAQKAVASAKRKATRAARGITTKKAKQAVTGNVVDVAIVGGRLRAREFGPEAGQPFFLGGVFFGPPPRERSSA
jgi:type I site-specific restriction endonuclease